MSSIPNRAPQVLSTSGAINPVPSLAVITKATAGAFTLVAPPADGIRITIVDTTGAAHTVTIAAVGSPATQGLDGGGKTQALFNGTVGSTLELESYNGSWYAVNASGVTLS